MIGYDEVDACPNCGKGIYKDLDRYFRDSADYSTEFDMECPHCGETMQVDVIPIPEFQTCKKQEEPA